MSKINILLSVGDVAKANSKWFRRFASLALTQIWNKTRHIYWSLLWTESIFAICWVCFLGKNFPTSSLPSVQEGQYAGLREKSLNSVDLACKAVEKMIYNPWRWGSPAPPYEPTLSRGCIEIGRWEHLSNSMISILQWSTGSAWSAWSTWSACSMGK